jgi:hypothetical protein
LSIGFEYYKLLNHHSFRLGLNLADEKRSELEKVLVYYGASEDSLKYRAACFLTLSYWNPDTDQFDRLSDFTEEDTITFYHNVPGNALLRFSGMTTGVNQRRVFILKNNSVAFY